MSFFLQSMQSYLQTAHSMLLFFIAIFFPQITHANGYIVHTSCAFVYSAKSCDNGKVYQPNVMTNCPLTCGMSDKSYFAQSCKTDGHASCECPAGLFKQNGTCVQAEDCQCKGDDQRYYNKGDVIRSSDNCLQW